MYNFPNYQQRLMNMEQMYNPQTIQTIKPSNPQVQCYFVNAKSELQNIQVVPNTYYIGINRQSKEIYLRTWNNDGMIDFDTYSLAEGKQESTDIKTILDKIQNLEARLMEKDDVKHSNNNVTTNAGTIIPQPFNANV